MESAKEDNTTLKKSLIKKKLFEKNFDEMKSISKIDILFLLDVTGSMDSYRDLLLNSVNLISERITKYEISKDKKMKIKVKFAYVAYRDKEDEDQFEIQQFTEDQKEFIKNLRKIICTGGGDCAEDVKGALQKVLAFDFTSSFKFVVLITDAPAHGLKYHENNVLDNYEEEDMTKELESLARKGIVFIGIKFTEIVEKMYQEIENIYKFSHGKFHLIKETDLQNIQSGNACTGNIINLFAQRISDPVIMDFSEASLKKYKNKKESAAISVYYGAKKYNHIKLHAKYENIKFTMPKKLFSVFQVFCNPKTIKYSNIKDLNVQTNKYGEWDCHLDTSSTFNGSFRQVFLLKVYDNINKEIYHKYVAKTPLSKPYYSSKEEIIEEWKGSLIAREMAKSFKEEIFEKCKEKAEFEIMFNDVFILKDISEDYYYACEKLIDGPFVKYNNNLGWVAEFPKEKDETETKREFESFNKVAQAFSHYTFQKSGGYLMVCDLQGCIQILTDPLVLTKSSSETSSDTGSIGIIAFFLNHKCNHICKQLGLTEMSKEGVDDAVLKEIEEIKKGKEVSSLNNISEIDEENEEKKEEEKMLARVDTLTSTPRKKDEKEQEKFFKALERMNKGK